MNIVDQITNKAHLVRTLAGAGIIRPTRPDKIVRIGLALNRWGPTPAAGYTASAIRHPDETAIIDELGQLTFREVHERTNALAHALAGGGVRESGGGALIGRRHPGGSDPTGARAKPRGRAPAPSPGV